MLKRKEKYVLSYNHHWFLLKIFSFLVALKKGICQLLCVITLLWNRAPENCITVLILQYFLTLSFPCCTVKHYNLKLYEIKLIRLHIEGKSSRNNIYVPGSFELCWFDFAQILKSCWLFFHSLIYRWNKTLKRNWKRTKIIFIKYIFEVFAFVNIFFNGLVVLMNFENILFILMESFC